MRSGVALRHGTRAVRGADSDMTISTLAVGLALIVLAAVIVLVLAAGGFPRPRYRSAVRRRITPAP